MVLKWTPPEQPLPLPNLRSVTPLQGEYLDRLYHSAVQKQRAKLDDYEQHMKEVVKKTTQVRPAALRSKLPDRSAEQLFYFPVRLRKQHVEDFSRSITEESVRLATHHAKLQPSEQDDMANRLCNASMEQKKSSLQTLEKEAAKRYTSWNLEAIRRKVVADSNKGKSHKQSQPRASSTPPTVSGDDEEAKLLRKLGKSELQASAERLCAESMRKKEASLKALEETFTWKLPPPTTRSKAEIAAAADRMFKGER